MTAELNTGRLLGPAATNESVAKLPEGKKVAGRWFLLHGSLCALPVAAGWLDGEQAQGQEGAQAGRQRRCELWA